MILQGLFNILDLYLNEIDLFYEALDRFFWQELRIFFADLSLGREELFEENLKSSENNFTNKEELLQKNFKFFKSLITEDKESFRKKLRYIFEKNYKSPRDLRREIRNLRRQNNLTEWEQKKEEWKIQREKLRKQRRLRRQSRKHRIKYHMTEIVNKVEQDFLTFLKEEFISLGFEKEYIEMRFMDPFLEIKKEEKETVSSPLELYKKKIAPVLYEIFLEKIADYLVDINAAQILLNLKARGFLPIEFMMELRNLKELLGKSETTANLKKYIQIRDKVIQKLRENKDKIESIEKLEEPRDKLQLMYLIFRIIDFCGVEKLFDFSSLRKYLKNNLSEWLISIPLISLKNPDLYFCGIYLANHLGMEVDTKKVKNFLQELYDENIDEFEAPIIEASDKLYYYLKSTSLIKWKLSEEKIIRLVRADPSFFKSNYLQELETSQLVVILKLYNFLGILDKVNPQNIKAIIEELSTRVTPEGIKQYRDGIISSEATYYILFNSYMRNSLEELKSIDFLETIVSRIYRNLEILDISQNVNYDLISELFYSIESLKLFNCIETKEMILHLANFLFPKEIVTKIRQREEIGRSSAKFRHYKVDRITGETVY